MWIIRIIKTYDGLVIHSWVPRRSIGMDNARHAEDVTAIEGNAGGDSVRCEQKA